ncbi:formate hydrogenlyase maturation HycH family protein [Sulfurospirillum barnesii]|uniref:Formate hydrogenlyase maturation protein HycH n=1 Tax=Sulfurospirillum barnesii (strain ATCC 700032 / DSM 10660 / SES-3) TaxID=760154 RepID=I3XZ70_SULBS|nr:formate hydrogenlyase maturation HycH family protein [Sulfurospirillum barnesii]AFL69244.1 Formate hydrogenlyase maturation protein HycH [Sulfurospirillum barnesii SES-3]
MIEVYQLMKRHLDGAKSGDAMLDQIKIFSTCIGHGVGTIDFSEKVLEINEAEYEEILQHGGEYLKFKLGNLSKYFEIEVFPEHAHKLLPEMIECPLKEIFVNLKEGYLVLRKDFA